MDQIILSKQKIKELKEQKAQIEKELKAHDKQSADEGTFRYSFKDAIMEEQVVAAKRSKLTELRLILQNVKELPEKVKSEKAVLGSWIILKSPDNQEVKYRLVHPLEAAPEKGLISVESPLGESILGLKKGDTVISNDRKYKVSSVE